MGKKIFGIDPDTATPEELEQIGSFILYMRDQLGHMDIPESLGLSKSEVTGQTGMLGKKLIELATATRNEDKLASKLAKSKIKDNAKDFADKTIKDYFKR